MTQSPEITPKSWLMVCILGVTWGSTFLVMELALRGMTPAWLAASRLSLAGLLMVAIQLYRRAPLFIDPDGPRPWGALIVSALLSTAIPFNLLSWGQQYVTSGFAGVSMAAVALIVLPLAHFFVPGDRMTPRRVIGFGIGFVGVVVLIGGQALTSSGLVLEPLGRLACLGAASCYAISTIIMRRLPAVDAVNLAGAMLLIGAVVALPGAWIVEGPPRIPPKETLIWVILLGLVPTAGANILRVIVVRQAGPVFMSITNYIVPVFSVIAGWLILSEPLPGSLIWAMLLIMAGVGLSQYGALRRLFTRKQIA